MTSTARKVACQHNPRSKTHKQQPARANCLLNDSVENGDADSVL